MNLLLALRPLAVAPALLLATAAFGDAPTATAPAYTDDGRLMLPEHYREWIFLSSGIDMSYNPKAMAMGHSMFDNVFVDPAAYRAFVASGHWPDKTVLVSESRGAESKGSINQKGQYQNGQIMGLEVHVHDEKRFEGGWGFFAFTSEQPTPLIPYAAGCYSCHQQHAAVDTTFVQFYPTLLPIAQKRNTLSEGFRKEQASEKN